MIDFIRVDEAHRGAGIGRALYYAGARLCAHNDLVHRRSTLVSESAQRITPEAFEAMGLVVTPSDDTVLLDARHPGLALAREGERSHHNNPRHAETSELEL